MDLRDYQQKCLEEIKFSSNESKSQLVILPTGAGKTVVFSHLIKDLNLKTLVVAHRRELLTQALNKIKLVHPQADVGIFDPRDKSTLHHKTLIGSIQACDNNFKVLQDQGFEMLIIDEAHHASAPSYIRLIRDLDFNTGDKWLIGFTATPERADKEPLPFKINSFHLPIIELVNKGHLVRPSGLHIELGIDLSTIAKDRGDFQKQSLKKVMLESLSREIVVNTIQAEAFNRHGIVFCVGVEHSDILAQDLIRAGFKAASCHSKLSREKRAQILRDFELGNLQFVTNPMILTEGFDCPKADCMINAAPTLNKTLYVQKAGRVLRLHKGKADALLIDFGRSSLRSSLCLAATLGEGVVKESRTIREGFSIDMPEVKPFPMVKDVKVKSRQKYNPLSDGNPMFDEVQDFYQKSYYWNPEKAESSRASEKQVKYLEKLSKETMMPIPEEVSLWDLSRVKANHLIDMLLKARGSIPATPQQKWKLRELFNDGYLPKGIDINSLSKSEARRFIGEYS